MAADGGGDGLLDAPLERHRAGAGGHVAQTLVDEGLGEHGGGGGAVTGDVVGLGGDLLHQLGAHVLEGVLQLHLAGDGDAVVGDGGGAELLVDDDVAALAGRASPSPCRRACSTPASRPRRAASSNFRILDIAVVVLYFLADLGEHVTAGEDEQVLALER